MTLINRFKSIALILTPPLILNSYNRYKIKPARYKKKNERCLKQFLYHFEVLEFSYMELDLPYNLKWGWWSRVFEYELVISKLASLGISKNSRIHNTCWGYHGSHILFKQELEEISLEVVNSDLLPSSISNTTTYDLRRKPPKMFEKAFDFVVNVSTIEEIAFPHIKVIENLLSMVKPGGYLIATFDVPGIQLDQVEKLFQKTITEVQNSINGENSPYTMPEYKNLEVGYFILRKL